MATPFTSTLSPGTYGPQVKALQQFLNQNGYQVMPAGQPGGPGMETEYFGQSTLDALQKFQKAYGIVSSGDPTSTGYGNFGPKTMGLVNEMVSQRVDAPMPTIPTPPPAGPNNDYTVKPANVITNPSGSAFFSNGKDALVTFSGEGATPNQIFLVDQENKQVIPFSSMQSAINYFSTVSEGPVTAEQINAALTQVPASSLAEGGSLHGFSPVPMNNGFNEEGHLINPAPSNANLQARYGKDVDQSKEMKSYTALDGFSKLLGSGAAGESSLSASDISKITSDPAKMAFYINALAYGGYSLQDVYKDMVRQKLIDSGQGTLVMNSYPISSSQDASTYKASQGYQSVTSNPSLSVTPTIAGIDASILNNPVMSLPDAAFSLISPLSNPNSPEFRAQMEQFKDATYQVALEMSQAANESDHARAQSDWATLKDQIQSRLGITLSDNAIQAWNQIDSFVNQAGQAGLAGSGMVEQKIDEYLRQQSAANRSLRKVYSSSQDQADEVYYQNYASPDEIKSLISSNPKKAKAFGLIMSDEAKAYMTIDNLQKLFPNARKEELQAIIAKYVDPNGNTYSKLYGNYAANKYDIEGKQDVSSAAKVMQESQDKAKEALRQYSDPNNPFLKPGENTLPTPTLPSTGTERAPSSGKAAEALQPAATVAGNLGTQGSSKGPTPPPNMTSTQQAAWNAALALIPSPTKPSTPAAPVTPATKPPTTNTTNTNTYTLPKPPPTGFQVPTSILNVTKPSSSGLGNFSNLTLGTPPKGPAPVFNKDTGTFSMEGAPTPPPPPPPKTLPTATISKTKPSLIKKMGSWLGF